MLYLLTIVFLSINYSLQPINLVYCLWNYVYLIFVNLVCHISICTDYFRSGNCNQDKWISQELSFVMQELNSSDQTICLHQIQIGHGSDIRVLELEIEEAWVGIPVWSLDQHISPISHYIWCLDQPLELTG